MRYEYTLTGTGVSGVSLRFGPVSAVAPPVPFSVRLRGNPGGSTMRLELSLPHAGDLHLALFDAAGREIARTVWTAVAAGRGNRDWDVRGGNGGALGPGIYFLRITGPWGKRMLRWVAVR